MSGPHSTTGPLEPGADQLAQQLQRMVLQGEQQVSDARLLSPFMLSLAISAKRIADNLDRIATHLTPPPGQEVGGFSQAELNLGDLLKDRLHDLAHDLRTDR